MTDIAENAFLAAAEDLPTFLASAGTLTLDERRLLVDQALVLFEQNYAHLPLKVAMHAVNPVQRLRLLRNRLERHTPETMDSETAFHAELLATFHSVRDLHTNYMLPAPYNAKIAFLPFQIEEYIEAGARKYVVSRLMQGFTSPSGLAGAEVTHWNGIPIARAVEINAARFAGSNLAARRARGVDSLTLRPLRMHLPPDEEWVTVGYTEPGGEPGELRQKWLVADNVLPPFVGASGSLSAARAAEGLDLVMDESNRAKTLLYAPQVVAQQQGAAPAEPAGDGAQLETTLPGVFRARTVTTQAGTFGHLRIFSFNVSDDDAFVQEFIRLVGQLPANGLILDVRGNGGGNILASERTLQTLTPRHIVPEPVQFISTPLNLRICARHKDNPVGLDLGSWFKSLDEAPSTGASFSGAFPITSEAEANSVGQAYQGPVVLVTDARCYSATDIFAAGFQDHDIGTVLGVDENTGAGGANVWDHELLSLVFQHPEPDPETPYKPLPEGAGMRVSMRRTLRVGKLAGTPVEDLGVVPDERHDLTRDDLTNANVDLLARAGALLARMPVRKLDLAVTPSGSSLTIALDVAQIDRADIYVDGRPRQSVDVESGPSVVAVENVPGARVVRAEGFAGGALVVARTVTLIAT